MIKFIFIFLFCFMVNSSFCQSQTEMNEKAEKEYQKAEHELNYVYKQILTEYQEDIVFLNNFKAAERLWIQFRDAEMKAKYPDEENSYHGTVYSMCWYIYLTELTKERTRKIMIWLTGIEEGDVCSGSVKTKE